MCTQVAEPLGSLMHAAAHYLADLDRSSRPLTCHLPSQGALLCLAAATVGLGEPSEAHLRQLVPPVLASFTDQDSRVRYYACEALYNIAKVARDSFIIFFNEVFDAMFRCGGLGEKKKTYATCLWVTFNLWAGVCVGRTGGTDP